MKGNSFSKALARLNYINELSYSGQKLKSLSIRGYNAWAFFQTKIFADVKRELENPSTSSPKAPPLSYWILGFLTLILSGLALLSALLYRRKVLVYSIDKTNSKIASNDTRLDDVYLFLKSHRISYWEYFHAHIGRSLFSRAFARRRLAAYDSTLDFLGHLGTLLGAFKVSLDLVDPVARKYVRNIPISDFKISVLSKILKWTRPKAIFSIDDPRDYSELALAAKLAQVPFIAFQHGHFTKYHVGWLRDGLEGEIARPTRLVVWSEYWKEELLRLGTYFQPEEIQVGGQKGVVSTVQKIRDTGELSILVPYEIDSIKDEVRAYIDALLALGVIIYFKLRTDLSREHQLKESGFSLTYHKNLMVTDNTEEALGKVDLVAGTYSTFLYDCIAYEKPVVLLDTSIDFGESMIMNGLADKVFLDKSLIEKLENIAETPRPILIARKEKLLGKEPKSLQDTLQSLARGYSL